MGLVSNVDLEKDPEDCDLRRFYEGSRINGAIRLKKPQEGSRRHKKVQEGSRSLKKAQKGSRMSKEKKIPKGFRYIIVS